MYLQISFLELLDIPDGLRCGCAGMRTDLKDASYLTMFSVYTLKDTRSGIRAKVRCMEIPPIQLRGQNVINFLVPSVSSCHRQNAQKGLVMSVATGFIFYIRSLLYVFSPSQANCVRNEILSPKPLLLSPASDRGAVVRTLLLVALLALDAAGRPLPQPLALEAEYGQPQRQDDGGLTIDGESRQRALLSDPDSGLLCEEEGDDDAP